MRPDMRSSFNFAPPNDTNGRTEGPRSVRQFVDNFLSPFVRCVQPQLRACGIQGDCRDDGAIHYSGSMLEGSLSAESFSFSLDTPHRYDVLCGRSSESTMHTGNQQFKSLIQANRGVYATLTKKQKMQMSQQVVDLIHYIGGRFRAKNSLTGKWEDVGMPRSLEKTSQAFRSVTSAEEVQESRHPQQRHADAPPIYIPPALEAIFRPQETSPLPPPPPPPMHPSNFQNNTQIFRPTPIHPITPALHPTYSHPRPAVRSPAEHMFPSIERVNSMPMHSLGLNKRDSFDAMDLDGPVGPQLLPGYKRARQQLYETDSLLSPTALTQGRSRHTHSSNTDGLSALSAAAFLRLDEVE